MYYIQTSHTKGSREAKQAAGRGSHEYCPTPMIGEKGCKVHCIQTFTHTSCHERIRGGEVSMVY